MIMAVEELSLAGLKAKLDDGEKVVLVDVREFDELEHGVLPGVVHIPMGSVPERLNELDPEAELIIICRTGNRSRKVGQYLASHGFYKVANLSEGMNGWAAEIDPTMEVY
jgi:rhodanese-related sulfurtransferase